MNTKRNAALAALGLAVILLACEQPVGTSGSLFVPKTAPVVPPAPDLRPAAPDAPAVQAWDGSLTAIWNAVSGAEQYEVYLSESPAIPASPRETTPETASVFSTLDPESGARLENGTRYYVWIKARNGHGAGAASDPGYATPWKPGETPQKPRLEKVRSGALQVAVSWERAGGAEWYEIYSAPANSIPATPNPALTAVTGNSAVITGLPNDTPCYVWVKAVNAAGKKSEASDPGMAIPREATGAPPGAEKPVLVPGAGKIGVSWQPVDMAAYYDLRAGTGDDPETAAKRKDGIGGDTLSAEIEGLANGNTWHIWLRAGNSKGTGPWSPAASAVPSLSLGKPAAPAGLAVTGSTVSSISLSWTAVSGAAYYRLYRSETEDGTYGRTGEDITGTPEYTDTGLLPDTASWYRVSAANSAGEGPLSPGVSGRTLVLWSVTIADGTTGGTVGASPESGAAGTLITLSNTPADGHAFSHYTVNGARIDGNTFTLNGNTTVGAVFIPVRHRVTIGETSGGVITASAENGTTETGITLSNTPDPGYTFGHYTVNGTKLDGNTFTLETDVTVSGVFTQNTYTVTVGTPAGGTAGASPPSGHWGDTVTLSNTPASGYIFSHYTVNGTKIGGNSFTLNGNATVSAVFSQSTYTVTTAAPSGGTVNAVPASGHWGDTVTLSNTPAGGYTFSHYTVNGTRIGGNSFTLSASVSVSAVFTQNTYTVTVAGGIPGGTAGASPLSGHLGDTVTLSNTPASGYIFSHYTVNGTQIGGNSFTLGANATVSAVFIPPVAVSFTGLAANGSATETTTKLTLTFDKDIEGLAAADIALVPDGLVKGTLTRTGTGLYELAVGNIQAGGTVSASATKAGHAISGNPQTAQVCHYTPPGAVPVSFTDLTADGSATETTTKLILTFDRDIAGLAAADITLDAGSTGAAKGGLTRTGTGVYELGVSGVTTGGTLTVSAGRAGYAISGSPKQAAVFHYTPPGAVPVSFTGLTADGSATETTTKLTLTFDKDIAGLTAADITLDAGSTGAAKGGLTRTGTGVYELAVTGITAGGTVSVSTTKSGYAISGGPKQAAVFHYTPPGAVAVSFTGLTADGSAMATTTKLTLTFSRDIEGLAADDITLDAGSTGAAKGGLTRTGTGVYELGVSGVTTGGTVGVSATKSGYAVSGSPKQTAVFHYTPPVPVSFISLVADGSETETTTKLTLKFDREIAGFERGDITLDAGTTGAVKGTLTHPEPGTCVLSVSGVSRTGMITVTVNKAGFAVSPGQKQETVYYAVPVTFSAASANGSATETTTKLTLTFDKDIEGLAAADITITPNGTGAVKGSLTRTAAGVYELAVTGITAGGTAGVSATKSGYAVSGGPRTATVNYAIPVTFSAANANGSATETTTKLTLTFSRDIEGLAAADITITPNGTGAVKGGLTRTGTGVYELAVTGITADGTVGVSAAPKPGYAIAPASKNVAVHAAGSAGLSISFARIADAAPSITGPTLYLVSNGGPTTATLTVDSPGQYSSINWRVDDTAVTGSGASFTLNAANGAYNAIAQHSVTVTVIKGGAPYSKTVTFTVEH